MTQLSGFALNVEASLRPPATIYFSMLLCCLLSVSEAAVNDIEIQSHPLSPPLLLPLTWFCQPLCESGCRRCGSCRRTASGWWPPCPSTEPSPRGWAQRRLWRCACGIKERTMWGRYTGTFLKGLFWHCWGPGKYRRKSDCLGRRQLSQLE